MDSKSATFRNMMEGARCTLFGDSIGGSYSSHLFALFEMLVSIKAH